MPRVLRTADVSWTGSAARGAGTISGGSGALERLPISLATRVGAPEGNTSPEELLAAAHAGCYAMSLASELTKAGTPPEQLDVTATATLDEVEGGDHRIVAVDIEAKGRVAGIDGDGFVAAARAADEGCPLSALVRASAAITIDARLDES